ncbi:MAG: hypothetical protein LH606_08990 [Cytophagaceae bacterium]|nr:hypothetical protein [Cytophagaceae bacterium]
MPDQTADIQQLAITNEALSHNLEAARDQAPQLLNGLIATLEERGFSEIAAQLHAFEDVLAGGNAASIGQAMQNLGKLASDAAGKAESVTAQRIQELAETLTRIGDQYAGERTTSVAS